MFCPNCGKEIQNDISFCPNCGHKLKVTQAQEPTSNEAFNVPKQKKKKAFYQKWWFWLLAILVIFFIIGSVTGSNESSSSTTSAKEETAESSDSTPSAETKSPKETAKESSPFDGSSGIKATGQMGTDIIGSPSLDITIENTTGKDITAIKFYAVPLDVYGDEIKEWTSQNYLYTDDTIPAGSTNTISYSFIEDSVKKIDLYAYSVYFSDGTEWGDKDAGKSVILDKGQRITVSGES